MTSFGDLQSSTESSRPLEIYKITLSGQTFRYTSAEDDVVVDGDTYDALPGLSREGRAQKRTDLKITVPASNSLAMLYVSVSPAAKASIWVWQLERDEVPTFNTKTLVFKGKIQNVAFTDDGTNAIFLAQSIEVAASQTIPRRSYMPICEHLLYGAGCGVDPSGFNIVGACTAASGRVITITGANGQPDGYYQGGYATPTGVADPRQIVSHVGNQITLQFPFAADPTGGDVQIFAGCDHDPFGDCATKFDNVIENGGHPFVPNRNPFTAGIATSST